VAGGGLSGISRFYRAHFAEYPLTREWAKEKLDIPGAGDRVGINFMKDEPGGAR